VRIVTGTDLVRVDRIQELLDMSGDRFLIRVFTAAEITECDGDAGRLAARWAAKEATMKALGRGLDVLEPTTIEVVPDTYGAPNLALTGGAWAAAKAAGWTTWSVSLSHDGDYATAVVVALRS
jgi:holo-[acyl-carrier protein] synthase